MLEEIEEKRKSWRDKEAISKSNNMEVKILRALSTGVYNSLNGAQISKSDVLDAVRKGTKEAILELEKTK